MAGATTVPAAPPAGEAKRWRDLRKRFLSALVLGPAALLCAVAWAAAITSCARLPIWVPE